MSVKPSKECLDAFAEIKNDKNETNWFLMTYKGDSKVDIELYEKGTGGFKEVMTKFDPGMILYGVFRVIAYDEEESFSSNRLPKLVWVTCIGSQVKPLKRAQVGVHSKSLESQFTGTHVSFSISTDDTLTEEEIVSKLQLSSGSHKPKGYKFD